MCIGTNEMCIGTNTRIVTPLITVVSLAVAETKDIEGTNDYVVAFRSGPAS